MSERVLGRLFFFFLLEVRGECISQSKIPCLFAPSPFILTIELFLTYVLLDCLLCTGTPTEELSEIAGSPHVDRSDERSLAAGMDNNTIKIDVTGPASMKNLRNVRRRSSG